MITLRTRYILPTGLAQKKMCQSLMIYLKNISKNKFEEYV